ncbi:MAG: hypothetical protein FD167_4139, partial [bacterium]
MDTSRIKIKLEEKIKEAKELSAHHKRELDKDQENFALSLRFNTFRRHIEDLENQLAAHEAFERGWNLLNQLKLDEAKEALGISIKLMPSYLGFLHNQLINNIRDNNLDLLINAMMF